MIAHEVHGTAPGTPILLVRPLGGCVELWGRFREALAASLRVISFDARGTGSSRGPAATSTRAMAREALEVLDAAGVARAHVFGLSFGGMAATWLAIDHPERVARLVLASTVACTRRVSRHDLVRALSLARCFARPGAEVERCLARRILSRELVREQPGVVAWIDATIRRHPTSRLSLLRHVAAAARHDARAALGRITAPTLVLAGGRDPFVDAAASTALARAIPGAVREVIAGAGHDLSTERPLEVAARVAAFASTD